MAPVGRAEPSVERSRRWSGAVGGAEGGASAACIDLSLSCMQVRDARIQERNAKSVMPNRNSPQIFSDEALLDAMMRGQRAAGYAPSSHWESYESATLAALHAIDLNNFLTVPNPFGNFYASRLGRPNIFRRAGYRLRKEFSRLVGLAEPAYPLGPVIEASCQDRMHFMAQEFAEAIYNFDYGHCLLEIEDSLAGNPPATFEIANRRYSFQFLHNFARAQWLLQHLELPEGACVAEIGPGFGGFIEVLRKVRPDLKIALIDIAPQLYITEQRCKAIFGDASQGPGSVVGFRTTTNMNTIDLATFRPGTIAIVAPWLCHRLRNIWLGINHASMQEMTRAQAASYIRTLQTADMEYFYLINYRPGVIGPPEEAVSSDFLVDKFRERGFSIKICGPNRKSFGDHQQKTFGFHDYILFEHSLRSQ
jgi:putative sugar O-methyltransferase